MNNDNFGSGRTVFTIIFTIVFTLASFLFIAVSFFVSVRDGSLSYLSELLFGYTLGSFIASLSGLLSFGLVLLIILAVLLLICRRWTSVFFFSIGAAFLVASILCVISGSFAGLLSSVLPGNWSYVISDVGGIIFGYIRMSAIVPFIAGASCISACFSIKALKGARHE